MKSTVTVLRITFLLLFYWRPAGPLGSIYIIIHARRVRIVDFIICLNLLLVNMFFHFERELLVENAERLKNDTKNRLGAWGGLTGRRERLFAFAPFRRNGRFAWQTANLPACGWQVFTGCHLDHPTKKPPFGGLGWSDRTARSAYSLLRRSAATADLLRKLPTCPPAAGRFSPAAISTTPQKKPPFGGLGWSR